MPRDPENPAPVRLKKFWLSDSKDTGVSVIR
jgi:hypothetical protein